MNEQLKLKNQVCFPLYATSRMITQKYKPLLDKLDVTYPQYIVLMVLWENDNISIKQISEKLLLETNTLTPLLKRMQLRGIIARIRSKEDERVVTISLTKEGRELEKKAADVPCKLLCGIEELGITREELNELKSILDKIFYKFNKRNQ